MIEVEKGESAIKVGKKSAFEVLLKALIEATSKGEPDRLFPTSKYRCFIGRRIIEFHNSFVMS